MKLLLEVSSSQKAMIRRANCPSHKAFAARLKIAMTIISSDTDCVQCGDIELRKFRDILLTDGGLLMQPPTRNNGQGLSLSSGTNPGVNANPGLETPTKKPFP